MKRRDNHGRRFASRGRIPGVRPASDDSDDLDDFVPFPLDVLPGVVAEHVAASAAAVQCDPTLTLLPTLSALGAAVGGSRVIELLPEGISWREPAVIWSVAIAEMGAGKTSARDVALSPVPDDLVMYSPQLDDVVRELRKDPPARLLVPGDLSDWLRTLDLNAMGDVRFRQWLEIHRGGSVTVEVDGGRPTSVSLGAVSVTGGVSPRAFEDWLHAGHYEERVQPRLLVAMPPWEKEHVWCATSRAAAGARLRSVLEELRTLEPAVAGDGQITPHALPLSAVARGLWTNFVEANEKERLRFEEFERCVRARFESHCARLALIHALVSGTRASGGDGAESVECVNARSMEAAIIMTRWFGYETDRVLGLLGIVLEVV